MSFQIHLSKMQSADLEEAFLLYSNALSEVIEKTFGWDEGFQRNRFQSKYDLDWFHWIDVDSQRVGYVCFYETKLELHVSLLIIYNELRGQLFGKRAMEALHQRARQNSCRITLSSFKNNVGAIRFYQNLGYEIIGEDSHFYEMALKI